MYKVFLLFQVLSLVAVGARDYFTYSGKEETWTVPTGIEKINFLVVGAAGRNGGSQPNSAGLGAYVTGSLYVVEGTQLFINIGGSGANGGCNGGGSGNCDVGGGASDIRMGGNTLYNRIIVAGGGGASTWSCGNAPGGNAGLNGAPGQGCGWPGGGATQFAGGAAGTPGGSRCCTNFGAIFYCPAGSFGYGGQSNLTGGYNGCGGGGYFGGGEGEIK
jgi:hypothetical protein